MKGHGSTSQSTPFGESAQSPHCIPRDLDLHWIGLSVYQCTKAKPTLTYKGTLVSVTNMWIQYWKIPCILFVFTCKFYHVHGRSISSICNKKWVMRYYWWWIFSFVKCYVMRYLILITLFKDWIDVNDFNLLVPGLDLDWTSLSVRTYFSLYRKLNLSQVKYVEYIHDMLSRECLAD